MGVSVIGLVSSVILFFQIKSHLSFFDSAPKELPLPRFMMSKTDAEIRFGNTTELHGAKVQIPYLITEKNTFKRIDDEDKQRVPLSHGYSKLRSSTEQMHSGAMSVNSFKVRIVTSTTCAPSKTLSISGSPERLHRLLPRFVGLQSEQASEAELHPQLNRAPSQAAESSPTKKEIPYSQPPSKPIRRKFRPENQATENQEPSTTVGGPASVTTVKPHPAVQKQSSKQKKAIQTAIRKNKEANAVLARLNSELQQQLKD
ncbi:hypothetical protein Celaphus_00010115 [Cervus elaphus hippelaphus]|uniref:Uncharacterized protein n=1 Tax=Cervus elaphus hippelaphus TaxID=46360 RepID=A0A212BZ90_CEREH|nr:hypothetical protein Celaphus_00010115 [Cervus elaphus hippelaphus]